MTDDLSTPIASLRANWSLTPTLEPHKILDGDQYVSRDIACARCGAKFHAAPWPKQEAVCFRPRCSHCGSSFTYPLAIAPTKEPAQLPTPA